MTARMEKKVSSPAKRGKIWLIAVDPFQDAGFDNLMNMVRPLSEHANARMEAAYVLAPASLNWTGEFSGPWIKRYFPVAQGEMKKILPADVSARHIIVCRQPGQRAAVKALVRFAEREDAACIVIATHARSGLERWAMGSFAETLILTSKVPVLVVNPDKKLPASVRKILVPTDLAPRSDKFISAIASYARAQGAEIVLYHKQEDPLDPIVQQGVYSLGGGWVSVQNFTDDERILKDKRIARLEAVVRRHRVPVSHVFDSAPRSLVEGIGRTAEEIGADMVSVLTHSDSWSAALLGSVARGLVRHSPIPILVQR